MSNFNFTAKDKTTGETVKVDAMDDYFGRHRYGYRTEGSQQVFKEEEFWQNFEEIMD